MNKFVFMLVFSLIAVSITSQEQTDSMKVANTLEEIFTVCNSSEPETGSADEAIIFERLAPYIVSMSDNESRNKKKAAD